MSHHSLLIAVENAAIENHADVSALAAALSQLDPTAEEASDKNQCQLTGDEASKAGIESQLKSLTARLTADDTCYLYYSGPPFSRNGENHLGCRDTESSDPAATSLALQTLFDQLSASRCQRFCLFFDLHHGGLPATASTEAFDDSQLQQLFDSAPNVVCFVSCRAGETSHARSTLQQGIWLHHLLECLRGDVSSALVKKKYLTAASLQNYLTSELPRTLRSSFTTPEVQTPWVCGGLSADFVLADLTPLLEQRPPTGNGNTQRLGSVVISARDVKRIKTLSGFKNSHHVPAGKNDRADAFIASISETELDADLDAIFQSLKTAYRFKRRELEKQGPADGSGVVMVPCFEYAVWVELDADDTKQVIWRRQISKISDPTKVFCDEFDDVFSGLFDTIEFACAQPLDVEVVIDSVEDVDADDVQLEYDADCTHCRLTLAGTRVSIHVDRNGLKIQGPRGISPRELLESALLARNRLAGEFGINGLPVG